MNICDPDRKYTPTHTTPTHVRKGPTRHTRQRPSPASGQSPIQWRRWLSSVHPGPPQSLVQGEGQEDGFKPIRCVVSAADCGGQRSRIPGRHWACGEGSSVRVLAASAGGWWGSVCGWGTCASLCKDNVSNSGLYTGSSPGALDKNRHNSKVTLTLSQRPTAGVQEPWGSSSAVPHGSAPSGGHTGWGWP